MQKDLAISFMVEKLYNQEDSLQIDSHMQLRPIGIHF